MDLMLEAGRSTKEKGKRQMAGVEKKRRCGVGETGTGHGHKSIHLAILIPSSRSHVHGQRLTLTAGGAFDGIEKGEWPRLQLRLLEARPEATHSRHGHREGRGIR
jgi:hypothetical protein